MADTPIEELASIKCQIMYETAQLPFSSDSWVMWLLANSIVKLIERVQIWQKL